MMKKKYITPAIQIFPIKMQLYLQNYSVKNYEEVNPILVGDNEED